jgi:hypothetical protein
MTTKIISLIFLLTIQFCFSQNYNPEISKYVDFLETQNVSAKDYILNLFEKYDIVVLCERHHGEMTQYDLIFDVVNSKYFQENVGNIFTEVGSIDNRENTQRFIHQKFKNDEEKTAQQLDVYRGMGYYGIWEKTNSYNFIGKLNSLNHKLNKKNKINLFTSDIRHPKPEETDSTDHINMYFKKFSSKRDSIMAKNVISTFDSIQHNSKRKKALVIMNYRHAFSKSFYKNERNFGDYLHEKYDDKFANVLINSSITLPEVDKSSLNKPKMYQDMSETIAQDGKWDAAFKVVKKENLGFDLKNTPFGNDYFNMYPFTKHNYNYQDIFTGFVFYLPIEKHIDSYGVKDLVKGHESAILEMTNKMLKALGVKSISIDEIEKISTVETEKSYDDLEKMLLIEKQWLTE